MKPCSRCGLMKPLDEFRLKMKRGKQVPESMCRECSNAYHREWRAAHPDSVREAKQRHRETHREEVNAYKREVYRRDPEKVLAQNRSWKERNPGYMDFYNRHPKRREDRLRRTHGITLEQYTEMWERQDGKCPICLRELPREFLSRDDWKSVPVRPHVDHCHVTDVIRGLLCSTCNQGIGLLREDPEMFARAVTYLSGQYPTITPDRPVKVSR